MVPAKIVRQAGMFPPKLSARLAWFPPKPSVMLGFRMSIEFGFTSVARNSTLAKQNLSHGCLEIRLIPEPKLSPHPIVKGVGVPVVFWA